MKKFLLALSFAVFMAVPFASVANEDVCDFAQEAMIHNAKTAGKLEFQIENLIIMEVSQTKQSLEKDLARVESLILSLKKDIAFFCK